MKEQGCICSVSIFLGVLCYIFVMWYVGLNFQAPQLIILIFWKPENNFGQFWLKPLSPTLHYFRPIWPIKPNHSLNQHFPLPHEESSMWSFAQQRSRDKKGRKYQSSEVKSSTVATRASSMWEMILILVPHLGFMATLSVSGLGAASLSSSDFTSKARFFIRFDISLQNSIQFQYYSPNYPFKIKVHFYTRQRRVVTMGKRYRMRCIWEQLLELVLWKVVARSNFVHEQQIEILLFGSVYQSCYLLRQRIRTFKYARHLDLFYTLGVQNCPFLLYRG